MTATPVSGKRPKRPTPVKHRWLDQWLMAKGEPLKRLVANTRVFVAHDEMATKARKRARRGPDRERHEQMIDVLVANLSYAVLNPSESMRIAVDTRHGAKGRSRYANPAVSPRVLRPFLTIMANFEAFDKEYPKAMRGEKMSIAPTDWWARKVAEEGITLEDFRRDTAQELILLNRNSRGAFDPFTQGPSPRKRERVEYRDTAATSEMRAKIRGLNDWLAGADIRFNPDGGPLVDPFDRIMRRHFVILDSQQQRFDQSGRLFGGFWQAMKSTRRKGIRINGECVADLDFSSMFTRLAYAEVGAVPPAGDLYAIPGLEGYRSGVKMAMNALLFSTGTKKTWPASMGVGKGDDAAAIQGELPAAEYEARLPSGWTVRRTKAAILDRHPVLRGAFGKGLGYRLMNRESEVLLAILHELHIQNIPALGLHDGLLVAASKADAVARIMAEVSHRVVGMTLPTTMTLLK